jgi:hypothetical protein
VKSKYFLIALLFSLLSIQANNVTSKSFFSTLPVYQSYSPIHRSAINWPQRSKKGKNNLFLNITGFGGASTNKTDLMKYFGINNKETLTITEDNTPSNRSDILAWNFNIATTGANFKSTLKFEPKQKFSGFAISGRLYVKEKLWVEGIMPIVKVENNMNLTETVITPGGATRTTAGTFLFDNTATYVGNMQEAFKQTGMKYGKINRKQNKTGIADIEFKVGYDSILTEKCYWTMYGGLIVPTSNKPNAEYIFEPIYGNGQHAGFMLGNEFGYEVTKNDTYGIWVHGMIHGQYLFSNTQKRSFDLQGKPWGRYLSVYTSSTVLPTNNVTWGINHLTQDVKVSPRSTRALSASFNIKYKEKTYLELGYAYTYRQAEEVALKEKWSKTIGIANSTLVAAETATGRSIGHDINGSTDGAYLPITESDLDLSSAAHPTVFSFTGYASITRKLHYHDFPLVTALGASYEAGADNTTLKRWTVWGKLGGSF